MRQARGPRWGCGGGRVDEAVRSRVRFERANLRTREENTCGVQCFIKLHLMGTINSLFCTHAGLIVGTVHSKYQDGCRSLKCHLTEVNGMGPARRRPGAALEPSFWRGGTLDR